MRTTPLILLLLFCSSLVQAIHVTLRVVQLNGLVQRNTYGDVPPSTTDNTRATALEAMRSLANQLQINMKLSWLGSKQIVSSIDGFMGSLPSTAWFCYHISTKQNTVSINTAAIEDFYVEEGDVLEWRLLPLDQAPDAVVMPLDDFYRVTREQADRIEQQEEREQEQGRQQRQRQVTEEEEEEDGDL